VQLAKSVMAKHESADGGRPSRSNRGSASCTTDSKKNDNQGTEVNSLFICIIVKYGTALECGPRPLNLHYAAARTVNEPVFCVKTGPMLKSTDRA
jgi:hypothetical protein